MKCLLTVIVMEVLFYVAFRAFDPTIFGCIQVNEIRQHVIRILATKYYSLIIEAWNKTINEILSENGFTDL